MSKLPERDRFRRTCLIKGRESEGRFALLRKDFRVSRVLAPGTDGEGEEVDSDLVYDLHIKPGRSGHG